MEKRHKRRNIFIKKDFQGKLILGYFLFATGGCLFFIVLLGFFSADSLTISYSNHDIQLGQTPLMLLKKVLAAHWIFIVLGGAFLVLASMLITHRIAGPIFRFEKALDNMNKGKLNDTIYLRDKDEGKDLARKINDLNDHLSRSMRLVKNNSQAIDALIDQAGNLNVPEEAKENLDSVYWAMQEHNKKILAVCNSFKLKDD